MVEAFVNGGMADCGHMSGSQIYVEAIVCYRVMEEESRIYLLKIKKIINCTDFVVLIDGAWYIYLSVCIYIEPPLYYILYHKVPIQSRAGGWGMGDCFLK